DMSRRVTGANQSVAHILWCAEEPVRKWNLKRPAAPKKTARKRTVFTAERTWKGLAVPKVVLLMAATVGAQMRRSQLISPRSCTRASANDSSQKKKPGIRFVDLMSVLQLHALEHAVQGDFWYYLYAVLRSEDLISWCLAFHAVYGAAGVAEFREAFIQTYDVASDRFILAVLAFVQPLETGPPRPRPILKCSEIVGGIIVSGMRYPGFADAAAVHAYAKLSGDIYGSGKFRANNCIAASLGPGLLEAFVVTWHDDAEDVPQSDSEEQMITPPRGIWFDAAQQLWRVSAKRLKDNDYLGLPCLHVSLDFWRVSSLICQWQRPALGPRGHLIHSLWSDLGINLWFVNALCFSAWHASHVLSVDEIAMNALAAYYLMLLLVKDAWESKGGRWDEDVGPRRAPRGFGAQNHEETTDIAQVAQAGRQELFPKLPNTVPNDVYEETWDEDDLSDSEGAEAIPGAANADLQAVPEDADATTVSEPDQETTAAPAEREAKRQRRPETKMTLRGILTDAGLEKFVPPANDSEFHVLSRVRGRCSHLRKFTEEIRVHGRVVRKPNVHNQMEHEFAKDCAAFQCSAEKQTRQKAMYHLSTMVLAEHSRWCTWGARFVRWAAPSRGSGSLEAGTQELFAESLAKGRLNMPLANAVRVMLLEPEQSAQAPYPFRCTALSPVFTLEAHSILDRSQEAFIKKVTPKIGEPKSLEKEGMLLESGEKLPCDVVVYATGYETGFDDIRTVKDDEEVDVRDDPLYHHTVAPRFPSLLVAPTAYTNFGPIRGVTMAQYITYYLAAKPSEAEMLKVARKNWCKQRPKQFLLFGGQVFMREYLYMFLDFVRGGILPFSWLLKAIWDLFINNLYRPLPLSVGVFSGTTTQSTATRVNNSEEGSPAPPRATENRMPESSLHEGHAGRPPGWYERLSSMLCRHGFFRFLITWCLAFWGTVLPGLAEGFANFRIFMIRLRVSTGFAFSCGASLVRSCCIAVQLQRLLPLAFRSILLAVGVCSAICWCTLALVKEGYSTGCSDVCGCAASSARTSLRVVAWIALKAGRARLPGKRLRRRLGFRSEAQLCALRFGRGLGRRRPAGSRSPLDVGLVLLPCTVDGGSGPHVAVNSFRSGPCCCFGAQCILPELVEDDVGSEAFESGGGSGAGGALAQDDLGGGSGAGGALAGAGGGDDAHGAVALGPVMLWPVLVEAMLLMEL
ncbi:unnamed protein product, partial [Symbiodinium sp. KB8]